MSPEERIKELEQEVAILKARDERVWEHRRKIDSLLKELRESLKHLEKRVIHCLDNYQWKVAPDESGNWWFHGEDTSIGWVDTYVDYPAKFNTAGVWVKKTDDKPPPPLKVDQTDILDIALYTK